MSARKKEIVDKKKKNSFHDKIDSKDNSIVLFYATWCPFSQRFLPVFRKYQESNPEQCLSVIVDEEPELCDEYGIENYPTVIMFKKGKVHKRLDAEHGVGLDKKMFNEFTEKINTNK